MHHFWYKTRNGYLAKVIYPSVFLELSINGGEPTVSAEVLAGYIYQKTENGIWKRQFWHWYAKTLNSYSPEFSLKGDLMTAKRYSDSWPEIAEIEAQECW